MNRKVLTALSIAAMFPMQSMAKSEKHHGAIPNEIIATQRAELAKNTAEKGFKYMATILLF